LSRRPAILRRGCAIAALVLGVFCGGGSGCDAIGGGGDVLDDAQQAIVDLKFPPAGLNVIGSVDRGNRSYPAGEPIGLTVEVNQPANVAVLRVRANGATAIVFPNRQHPSAEVPANSPLRIPDPGSPLKITGARTGTVLFEFIAATRGGSWLFTRKPEGAAEFAELGTTTRALAKNIVTSLRPGPGAAVAAAHVTVEIKGD